MMTHAHSAMSEFNVKPLGAYFAQNYMWEVKKQDQYLQLVPK